jgi:hypothetical protein
VGYKIFKLKCKNIFFYVDVEWQINSIHNFGARGLRFVSHPDPGWHFNKKNLSYPFFLTTDFNFLLEGGIKVISSVVDHSKTLSVIHFRHILLTHLAPVSTNKISLN